MGIGCQDAVRYDHVGFACAQGGGKSAAEDDDGGARRAEMVGRLVAIARAAGLADENVHDAVMLLDRLLRLGLSREAASPAVLAGVAVLSTKQGAPAATPRTTSLDEPSSHCAAVMPVVARVVRNPAFCARACQPPATHCCGAGTGSAGVLLWPRELSCHSFLHRLELWRCASVP